MIKSFNPIKSRRPWPPISISHLFQQGPFSSWPLLFLHLGCFCLDYICRVIAIAIASYMLDGEKLSWQATIGIAICTCQKFPVNK